MYCEHDRMAATCEACHYERAKAEGRPVAPSLYQATTHTDPDDDDKAGDEATPARARRKR